MAEFADGVDIDKVADNEPPHVAHNEAPHLDLRCSFSSL